MATEESIPKRPYVGMHFKCCNVYARIYLDAKQMHFRGGCPRCGRQVQLKATPSGSKANFWEAG
jgi:phage terminase large subunit GpA-like protein